MEPLTRFSSTLSRALDRIAGWAIAVTMLLVVSNVILRILGRPVQGTYE